MARYICIDCKKGFGANEQPNFCPYCGSAMVTKDNRTARRTAEKLIGEISEEIPVLDKMWNEYVSLLAEYEYKMVTLRQYKHRGIISENEIPSRKQETLAAALKKYRAERAEMK